MLIAVRAFEYYLDDEKGYVSNVILINPDHIAKIALSSLSGDERLHTITMATAERFGEILINEEDFQRLQKFVRVYW